MKLFVSWFSSNFNQLLNLKEIWLHSNYFDYIPVSKLLHLAIDFCSKVHLTSMKKIKYYFWFWFSFFHFWKIGHLHSFDSNKSSSTFNPILRNVMTLCCWKNKFSLLPLIHLEIFHEYLEIFYQVNKYF